MCIHPNPQPYNLNPKPYTLNPKPYTLNPKPYTLNPKHPEECDGMLGSSSLNRPLLPCPSLSFGTWAALPEPYVSFDTHTSLLTLMHGSYVSFDTRACMHHTSLLTPMHASYVSFDTHAYI